MKMIITLSVRESNGKLLTWDLVGQLPRIETIESATFAKLVWDVEQAINGAPINIRAHVTLE